MSVRICVPREITSGETRVGLSPDAAKRLASETVSVAIETGAGDAAGFRDDDYSEAGVEIVRAKASLLGG